MSQLKNVYFILQITTKSTFSFFIFSSFLEEENIKNEIFKSSVQNVTIGLNLIISKLYDNRYYCARFVKNYQC
jgi:hypothetical protein